MFWLRNKKIIFLLRTLNLSPVLHCLSKYPLNSIKNEKGGNKIKEFKLSCFRESDPDPCYLPCFLSKVTIVGHFRMLTVYKIKFSIHFVSTVICRDTTLTQT